jgi:hypothetical protein
MTIASQDFREIKNDVHTDARGRLTLGAVAKEKKYKVFVNDMGQILLDPVVSIPERELWLWQNAEALDSVKCGLKQSAEGQGRSLGSFAQYAYADLEIDN